MIRQFIISITMFSMAVSIYGYEVDTHAAMSREAYNRSILANQDLYDDLGIGEKYSSIGRSYYDYDSENEYRIIRNANHYENSKIRRLNVNPFIPIGWVMRGAIREDDCFLWFCKNPDDGDPVGTSRPLNHFFDPINNVPILITNKTAPEWSLGTLSPFSPPIINTKSKNHFTNFDAQRAMIRALAGQFNHPIYQHKVQLTEEERKTYWATLFRSLGNMIHLIQDMGQPQHTRGDDHSPRAAEERRVYEEYTNIRTLSRYEKYTCLNKNIAPITPDPLRYSLNVNGVYTDYMIPVLNDFGSYFSTEQKGGNVNFGKGLADYSNRGFFTAGTNKESGSIYPSPENKPLLTLPIDYVDKCLNDPNYSITLYSGEVVDQFDQSKTTNIVLTARSLWDVTDIWDIPGETITLPRYTLTQQNYIEMADQLIPRAVAYSAGFINYFFRGRVEVDVTNNTGSSAKIDVKNVSYENNTIGPGEFRIYYDAADGDRKEITINNESGIVSTSLALNTIHKIDFEVPGDIDYSKENPIVLVYSGLIGQEQGVIGKVFSMLESSGFVVTPDFVLADGKYGSRSLTNQNGAWSVSSETGFVAGNIDWKGWYVNGKPTQALTWFGPQARYFPGGGFGPQIYKGGDIYAVAPGRVLGAALKKDSNGNEWILAIVEYNWGDRVYKRPNIRSTSAALYDPQNNPDGWRLIGDITPIANAEGPDIPWFFNGDGTAAQTMRKISDNKRRMRLLMNISDASAVMTNLGNIETDGVMTEESTGTVRTTNGNSPPSASELCKTGTESLTDFYEVTDSHEYTKRQDNENIVAVDYINNAEIVAKMILTGSEDRQTIRVNRTDYSYQCEEPNKFAPGSGSTNAEAHEDAIITKDFSYILDIKGETIVLYSSSEDNIWSKYSNYKTNKYRATYTGSEEDFYPRLAFLDLRNKTYVMSTMLQKSQASGNTTTSSDPNWISGGYSEEWAFDLNTPKFNENEVINSYSSTFNGALERYPAIDLNAKPYSRTAAERVPDVDYYYGYEGSWLTDLDGNQFITMQKLYGHTFQTYPGYINHLSNGSLDQVFGQDTSNSSFYPAGIQ